MKPGISGNITRVFIRSPLTPLLLIASLVMGVIALLVLPREEEPQISVPMVDIIVSANGIKADDAIELITKPLEDIVKGINQVEHVYSQTNDNEVVVTARFFVGTSEDAAVLRVRDSLRAHLAKLPYGIAMPLIVGRGIDDVPIMVLTISPKPGTGYEQRWTDNELFNLGEELLHQLVKVDDVGKTFIVGGRASQIRVEPDPERLSQYGITLNQLVEKVRNANRSMLVGRLENRDKSIPVVLGKSLQGVPDIGQLLITSRDNRPVYVSDVANIIVGSAPAESRVWNIDGNKGKQVRLPAVSIAIAKRKGANAVNVANDLLDRLESVRGRLIPKDIKVEVTRNYGKTAEEKANELLFHLGLATVSIVLLISLAIGWREGAVVMVVIPTTILLTLFASYLMGYTINRVSLFALIFSIGIMVDDAIVIVENIVRHWRMKSGSDMIEAAIEGVSEVGNPTIIATLTIIAALLPMMFVSGLMGPYMSPIPANASAAMLFSFFVATIITPWLLLKLAGKGKNFAEGSEHEDAFGRLYRRLATPVLKSRKRSAMLLAVVTFATVASMGLFVTSTVTVKLLPFDNKSEVQVMLDLPEGSSLESTQRSLFAAANAIGDIPELTSVQVYVGTSSPFSFNGLVRHYYMRNKPELGDLQVNLLPKGERDRASHEIALDIRARLGSVSFPDGTSVKVVEVPPGPPVISTLLAEIYGPDAKTRRAVATKVGKAFRAVDFIVDVDNSFGVPAQRLRFTIDQQALELLGVQEQSVYDTISALLGGVKVGYSQRGHGINPIEIVVRQPRSGLFLGQRLLSTPIPAPGPAGDSGRVVELGDVVKTSFETASFPLFRRDGRFAEMVTGDMAGRYEAPVYGMLAVEKQLKKMADPPDILYHGQPSDESKSSLLWDGEWEVTYVTFRDMGAAFVIAIMAIYLLVVGLFRSFTAPLIILVPVPLTLIGIIFGHWLFSAPFTATSMIGFIALAGIIVRNSILLVDFINHRLAHGDALREALLEAGATRFKPIFLTAMAAITGSAFILTDPIFQGLAISMVFGLISSTALTLLVIPALYISFRDTPRDAVK